MGVAAGGVSVGVSLAAAVITPHLDSYIGGGTVLADQGIAVKALYNYALNGAKLNRGADAYADPLPQALVLTAIVISFGMTALIVVLALRGFLETESDTADISADKFTSESEADK